LRASEGRRQAEPRERHPFMLLDEMG